MYVLKVAAGYIKLVLLRFLDLADVDSYVGHGGKVVVVKPGGDGLSYASSAPVEINVVGEDLYNSQGFAIQGFGGVTVTAIGTDGGGRRHIKITGGGTVPGGTNKQTLYFNGTTLTATSAIQVDGSYIGIGAAPTFGQLVSIGDAGSGEGVRASANSGIVMKLFVVSGYCIDAVATSSGMPIRTSADTGYGGHLKSDKSYGAFMESRQHGAGFAHQGGTLTGNNTGATFTISRALIEAGFTALQPLLRLIDAYGSGGDIAYAEILGDEKFRIDALGMVFAQLLNFKSNTGTLVTGGANHDVALGDAIITFIDATDPANSMSGIADGVEDQIRILVFHGGHVVLPHENTSSVAENRFNWPSGSSSSHYCYFLWYHDSRWRVLFWT